MKDKIALSVSEMALQLGISITKAYELTKEPGFPILKIGTRILIPKAGFQKWLNVNSRPKK